MPTREDLKEMQSWSLEQKIKTTQTRILEWYHHYDGQVFVSFSGGKDSTVLLDLARRCFPDIEAVFVDTGLEYPEIRKFVKTFDNVTILKPDMGFAEVVKKYGYPLISKEASERVCSAKKCIAKNGENYVVAYYQLFQKFPTIRIAQSYGEDRYKRCFDYSKWKDLVYVDFNISNQCCNVMKKKPLKKHEKLSGKKPITAQMASESQLRRNNWIKNGCNGFDMKAPISNPMSFWTEQDVLAYIKRFNIPICSVYGEIVSENKANQLVFDEFIESEKLTTSGCKRTGCVFCGFGCHLEKKSKPI